MASQNLATRMQAFKDRMMAMAKGKHTGYDALGMGPGLDTPLVSGEDGLASDTTAAPAGAYRPPTMGGGPLPGTEFALPDAGYAIGGTVPNPAAELRELTHLAKEAASILWEMIALDEGGEGRDEMVERAEQLQAQLRGQIGDVADGVDEESMADAFNAFDMVSQCLAELSGAPVNEAAAPVGGAPSAPVVAAPAAEGERPLIEL